MVTDEQEIANEFNQTFQSVFNERGIADSPLVSLSSSNVMPNLVLAAEGIFSLLLNIDVKKSVGADSIPNGFLKRYAEMVSQYLYVLFSASLKQGCLPTDWLNARVVPVHKSGDKLLATNYRPISLTSTCCKVLEHILVSHITQFLESNNILVEFQHGFRKKLSTTTQLITVIHDFSLAINKNEQLDAIFLDFSKAFDRVPHHLLIDKLKHVGVAPELVCWIRAYLNDRKQFVEINNTCSVCLDITSGVPERSVLGPLLFLLYVNDIATYIDCPIKVKLFADDCVIYSVINEHQDQLLLNSNLCKLGDWCERWKMKINYAKTFAFTVTRKKKRLEFQYTLNNNHIVPRNEVSYLGLTITSNLKWGNHINNLCAKAFKKLCFLRRKLGKSQSTVKLNAYKTLIRPTLEYASAVWDRYHEKKDINKIKRIQRIAARFIAGDYRHSSSVTEILRKFNLESLEERRRIIRLKFFISFIMG